jgi:hypothetical protein
VYEMLRQQQTGLGGGREMNLYIIIALMAFAYGVGYIAGTTKMHNDYLELLGKAEW